MPNTLEALSATVAEWLTQEEQTLTRLSRRRRRDPEMAERLRLWKERLDAYERLETALAGHRAAAGTSSADRDTAIATSSELAR